MADRWVTHLEEQRVCKSYEGAKSRLWMNSRQRKQFEHKLRKAQKLNSDEAPKLLLSVPPKQPEGHLKSPEQASKQYRPVYRGIWAGVCALAVLMTIAGFLYLVKPRISLTWGEPLDPGNPLSGLVTISNDGVLPIYDLWVNCSTGVINDKSGGSLVIPGTGMFRHAEDHAERIGPGQKFTTLEVCKSPVTQNPVTFDFTLRVTYKPLLLPHDHADFRIVNATRSDGRTIPLQRER